MYQVKALILTGYGLNCDYETDFSLRRAGAQSHRIHMNEIIKSEGPNRTILDDYHILVFGGGFSWADDHGAGVIMASKLRLHLGDQIKKFVDDGKLVLGICNGFQALVNLGLLPGFENEYGERKVALVHNDSGNFIDSWVNLKINRESPCVFTRGISQLELPVRHGEGKFYAGDDIVDRLLKGKQNVIHYAMEDGREANGEWPQNPNGSLRDIAGICDYSGRVFGLMPHPEAFNHYTNHPDWSRKRDALLRKGEEPPAEEGAGIKIFRNAVDYMEDVYKIT
ncbi:MAG: phosphoribosylformylglycinamidine synthase subunit PurQ [Desulfatiglans sp.]|jgi:phosphoribosylformylglycinamidine synthase|nr:phosphoribosylformylglycinamidine synthase subunit PurQ [Thermodesulfobacteriota bacterium]MEE4354368.1 phosphoribosylformylglycinamidine synthase subunit PurQ [Desulfatiglans sp.]